MGGTVEWCDFVSFRNILLTHNFCIIIIIIDFVQPADLCVIIITIFWPRAELCINHPCCNLARSLFPSRQTLEDGRPTSPYWLYQPPPSIFLIILPGCLKIESKFPFLANIGSSSNRVDLFSMIGCSYHYSQVEVELSIPLQHRASPHRVYLLSLDAYAQDTTI